MEAVIPAGAAPPAAPAPAPPARDLGAIIPAKLRADIIMRRQFFRHEEFYVLKDPMALTYFRLQPEEAYVISLLDGKRNLREIAARFAARYPNADRSLEELAGFVNQMAAGRLLNQNASRFVDNARLGGGSNFLMIWAKIISHLLFIKIPLVDPSPWLGRLAHAIRFVWTKWFVGGALVLFAWTFGLLAVNLDAFTTQALDFFSASNLALLWLTIIGIKTLHEFGHATTCRHFGSEVHEMGLCFMCFTPCGYVDASDAWMMRQKKHKLFVTIAGVFTELIIACIAAHFWLLLPDGLGRGLAFNAMLVASINTLLFNANPLMRFDGYYLVCDLLDIPNLRSKAIAFCSYHLQRIFLGYRNRQQEAVFEHDARGRVFLIYALCAYGYMIFIIYGLTQIFGRVLQPYGLQDFGLLLGFLVEGSFVALPFIKVFMDSTSQHAHITKDGSTRRRLSLTLAALVTLVGASFFLPAHFQVSQQAVVLAESGEHAASETGGLIRQIHVHTGQWVEAGALLVTLENPEVEAELVRQDLELQEARLRFGTVGSQTDWASGERRANAAQNLEVAETAYARVLARARDLQLRAKTAGFVLTPELEGLIGSYASPLAPVLRVADTRRLRLVVPLTEDQAQLVEAGNPVHGRWQATGAAFTARLDAVAAQPAKRTEFAAAMMTYFGGPTPAQIMQTGPDAAHFPIFLATAGLTPPDHAIVEGLRVRVEVEGRETTVAKKFTRWFLSLFKPRGLRQ